MRFKFCYATTAKPFGQRRRESSRACGIESVCFRIARMREKRGWVSASDLRLGALLGRLQQQESRSYCWPRSERESIADGRRARGVQTAGGSPSAAGGRERRDGPVLAGRRHPAGAERRRTGATSPEADRRIPGSRARAGLGTQRGEGDPRWASGSGSGRGRWGADRVIYTIERWASPSISSLTRGKQRH